MVKRHLIYIYGICASALLSGCVYDDFKECPNEYSLRLVYDRNMLGADAFASQVKSVDIKVFDHTTGQQVYHHTEQGSALAASGYNVALPVPPGSYDILCWGSMAEGESFGYADPRAEVLEHHNVILNTEEGNVSRSRLNNLFHGLTTATFTDNNDRGYFVPQSATLYLTKNTNRVNIILLNLDGRELAEDNFDMTIASRNGEMAADNSLGAQRRVTFKPWSITPILSETDDGARAVTQSGLSAEFSLARLTATTSASRLDVVRKSDGERIISIPLERNLLLYKGAFHSYMADDEFLDRKDDYTITFILDKNNNWNSAAMISINGWATLPIQYTEW